jgi:hypothetical protein
LIYTIIFQSQLKTSNIISDINRWLLKIELEMFLYRINKKQNNMSIFGYEKMKITKNDTKKES